MTPIFEPLESEGEQNDALVKKSREQRSESLKMLAQAKQTVEDMITGASARKERYIVSAPRHIVDSIESVLSIYFSSCRLKERAAFLLCDELVEVSCRAKIRAAGGNPRPLNFPDLLTHASVGLDIVNPGLGRATSDCHQSRNDMQHNNPAATVDATHCADAIMDAVEVIEHCFPGTKAALPDKLKVTLRLCACSRSKATRASKPSSATQCERINGAELVSAPTKTK